MAFVSTYFNFEGTTEEAMNFYADLFGVKDSLSILRFSDMPSDPNAPQLPEEERGKVMHASFKYLDHTFMATDMLKSMGHALRVGNNTTVSLNLDSREEADRLHAVLSEGSEEKAGMMDMGFGYWGTALDKYKIRWMFNVAPVQG